MTEPGRIASTALGRDQLRGRPSGHGGGRDHDVEVGHPLLERALLLRLLLRRELPRVAALRLLPAHAEVEERRAERLHLLLDRRPDVERRHDRAEPPRGRDRLQARDAGAEHEDARRRDRPGRGHQHREELRAPVGAEQHALVAGDRRLRGERVHRLRARDPGHRLHRERDDAALAQPLDALGVGQAARGSRSARRPRERRDLVRARLRDTDDDARRPQAGSRGRRASRRPRRTASSGNPARTPAPRSTTTSKPDDASFAAASGVSATRCLAGRRLPGHAHSHLAGIYGKGSAPAPGTRRPVVRLAAFATAMEVCDPALDAHAARVGANAEAVARPARLGREQLEALRLGAALHDVGKVNVRAEVLTKPGRSTTASWPRSARTRSRASG